MKRQSYHVSGESGDTLVEVPSDAMDSFVLDGVEQGFRVRALGNRRYLVRDEQGHTTLVDVDGSGELRIATSGTSSLRLNVIAERDLLLRGSGADGDKGSGEISVLMPGKIVKIFVAVGDAVEEGVPVLIAEAMKMENEVKSTCSGVVSEIRIAVGDAVESGRCLMVITPEEKDDGSI